MRGPAYEAGNWISSHADEIAANASNPAYLFAGALGLTAALGAGGAARAAVPSLYHRARRDLAEGKGAITWGHREEGFWDRYAKIPVIGLWSERLAHTQLVAPTRRGKTQALLHLMVQDLEAGRDVLVVEGPGDLGPAIEAQARARGCRVLKTDATARDSLPVNPLRAATDQEAAQRVASTMQKVATDHSHYSSTNENLARSLTILARDHKRYRQRDPSEATLDDVRAFVEDLDYLRRVLRAYEGDDGQTYIDAPWLSQEAARWIEQHYLRWRSDYRENSISGFLAHLNNLLYTDAARKCLCPDPGEEALDLSMELSDEAESATAPGQKGRLILLRFPKVAFEGNSSGHAAYWVLKFVTEVTERRTQGVASPLAFYLDEFAAIVGERNRAALTDFNSWLLTVGKLNVAVTIAYQGWRLLPEVLKGMQESNSTNLLISGGFRGEDARYAQELLGSELREENGPRRKAGGLGGAFIQVIGVEGGHRRPDGGSEKGRLVERPRHSRDEIERLPRGYWWLKRFHDDETQKPALVHIPMVEMPANSSGSSSYGSGGAGDTATKPTRKAARLLRLPRRGASGGPGEAAPAEPIEDAVSGEGGGE